MAKGQVKFERRMSDAEALMWALEDDPVLRSSFANLTILDRPVDVSRFRDRMATAVERLPRLHQRVVDPPGIAAPRWTDDPLFDLDFHIRHVALPPPGDLRQLLDLAAILSVDPFDRARPLWQFTIVDGLADGRGAMVQKLHHTITDGEGGVRISAHFLDLEPDATEPLMVDPPTEEPTSGFSPVDAVRRPLDLARRAVTETLGMAVNPLGSATDGLDAARSVLRQVAVTEPARSPLWAARSLRRRFEIFSIPLDATKEAAAELGGTINDLFVTGAVGGAGAYHRARGVEIDQLRMAMPISTRAATGDASNAFTPTRMLVPAGMTDPRQRFERVQAVLRSAKAERTIGLAASLAGVLASLPTPVLLRAARQQVGTVDFTTSNVRAAPFDLYIAGARVAGTHPLGPMAGTAFNLTTMSLAGKLDMGLLVDDAAVDDAGLLRDCMQESFAELLGTT